ncbi:MAG: tetratricopeptide repeat protein [Candidatus Omnitrophica bacterium]|nr:tetratricopeptide repeat protein [Candidatus Omnitrophota bacterium]
MKKNFLLVMVFFFMLTRLSSALEWKKIHNEADATTLQKAQKSVLKNPNSIPDLYRLSLVDLNLHKDNDAKGIYTKILSLDPKSLEALWGQAEVLRRQDKLEESNKILNKIIKSNPKFSPALISLAYIQYTLLKFDDAAQLAKKVIDQGKDNVDLSNYTRAHLILAGSKGMIASRGGLFSKFINGTAVLPLLKKAQKLQPDSPAVLFGLGSYYFLAPHIAGGNLDKAIYYLELAVKADPLFADAHVRLAQAFKTKGDIKKYQEHLNKAIQIDPLNALALDEKNKKCKFNCSTVHE